MSSERYEQFLAGKRRTFVATGLEVSADTLNPKLFEFQRDVVAWALRKGKACVFLSTGLGKTAIQLEWAQQVRDRVGPRVLIVAPLAVASQTVTEGQKFGIVVRQVRSNDEVRDGVSIVNYERLDALDLKQFSGVVLDESSILKSYTSKTRNLIIDSFADTPFKLACTATPAPNDHMELGNHAEFVGVMSRTEMLSMFFVHDGSETTKWRLKGHAEAEFWRWMASWAVMLSKPSDAGYDVQGYDLPPLHVEQVTVDDAEASAALAVMKAGRRDGKVSLDGARKLRQVSLARRVEAAAEYVNQFPDEQWVVWCDLNDESKALTAAIPGAVEVTGSDPVEWKERASLWFKGEICECQLRRKLVKRTCATGYVETRSESPRTAEPLQIDEMLAVDNYTLPTRTVALAPDGMPVSGSAGTPKLVSHSDSDRSGSPRISTGGSTSNKETAAPSAGETSLPTEPLEGQDVAYTSTTATARESSAVSSAPPATSASESLETTQPFWNKPQCTCAGVRSGRVLISKPSIFGYGLNWQHCQRTVFVGLSFSFESYYQAVRRFWRFGQTKTVYAYVVTSSAEGAVVDSILEKERKFDQMLQGMISATQEITKENIRRTHRQEAAYVEDFQKGKSWMMMLGDACTRLKEVPSDRVGFSIFSPPFASLYTYSNSERDLGNSSSQEGFFEHFRFIVDELLRVTMPGRLVAVHCMLLPTSKERDGYIGLRDFRGDVVRMFQAAGFIFHSETAIWKNPVIAMQRTKALGLLHKTIRKDSAMSRCGINDYLVVFRKPGENTKPISHTHETFPVSMWQQFASPVWADVNPSDTLQYRSARDNNDERHICPLQLSITQRATYLWSNPGDLVLSPFAGIGSEGWQAISMGRRFLGIELKQSYFDAAVTNLKAREVEIAAAGGPDTACPTFQVFKGREAYGAPKPQADTAPVPSEEAVLPSEGASADDEEEAA